MLLSFRAWAPGALAFLLLGCGAAPESDEGASRASPAANAAPADVSPADTTPSRQPSAPLLAIDGEGLRLVDPASGRTTPLPFGTSEARVLDALARSAASLHTDSGASRACTDTRARSWPDGFTVVFRDSAFVGWELDERNGGSITTLSGVGIGSTREQLEWSYVPHVRREIEGTVFTAGKLHGTFEGEGQTARIRSMWAGSTCEPRAPPTALEPVTPETHGVLLEGIPPFTDLVADRHGDWFVVLGSFPPPPGTRAGVPGPGRTATLMRPTDAAAAALQQRLWNEGIVPYAVWSDILPNFSPGMVVLLEGPYPRPQAAERLDALRAVVPDAYLKSGW